MPDVIIKGMEMPEHCGECMSYHNLFGRDICWAGKGRRIEFYPDKRPEWCPLAPAPGWIPADKPPRPGERVILRAGVFVGEGYYTSAHTWRRITGMPMRDITDEPVTEWMSLPEVPE